MDEKKTRLAEIKEACDLFLFPHTGTEKLQVDDTYGLAPSEEGKQLTVADSEISAPKYLSAAERAAKEAEEAEEAARKAAAGSDDAVGRALNDVSTRHKSELLSACCFWLPRACLPACRGES